MSTQLILLPQTYLGVSSGTGNVELVSDGVIFSSINSAYLIANGTASPLNDIFTTTGGTFFPGLWTRWVTDGSGGSAFWFTPADPTADASGNLVLNTVGIGTGKSSGSGVIQKLSNLSVGTSYIIELEVSIPVPVPTVHHIVKVVVYNGSTPIHTYAVVGLHGVLTTAFIAQSSFNTTITVSVYDNVNNDILIHYISVKPSTVQTLGEGNGQVICDLYQEEDIPLTLSVDDFKNVTEQVKSYSKSFNLPATKRNNRIFNNMFDVTRADDGYIFNPYVKTACLLKQDGFIIFEGFLRLIDVKDKQGQISYNVNLYSEVIALADVLKDRTFADLDFSELDHDYNFANIRESWQGTLELLNPLPTGTFAGTAGATVTSVLKYPFIDWNHQLQVNINGNPELPALENVFRPCIKLKYLIQNIFAATDFNYTSDFFDTAEFNKLYMDFNWGAENSPVTFHRLVYLTNNAYTELESDWVTMEFPNVLPVGNVIHPDFGYDAGVFTALEDNQVYTASPYLHFQTNTGISFIYVQVIVNGAIELSVGTYVGTGLWTWNPTITIGGGTNPLAEGDTWSVRAKYTTTTAGATWMSGGSALTVGTSAYQFTNSDFLQTLRGELGQWDFLKGIMTMFNLVSMKDENNPSNILIEPYNEIFLTNSNTKELDWTDKVDVSEMSLKPLTDLNKNTIFQFVEDDDDYTFMQYKKATGGHLYGSKELDASTSGTTNGRPTILQGTKKIEAEPFAATVSKPLMSQYPDFIVPSIYAMNDDGESEGFDNSPRIFYNNYVKTLTSCTYAVPSQNCPAGTAPCGNAYEEEFLQFSHLTTIPSVSSTTTDFVFESSQLFDGVGDPPVDNLFNTYWAAYFTELYHADTRTVTLKVNLSPSDLATFKFYDKVFIRNRIFRVNKIEYKPNSLAKVEFILIP